MKVGKCRKELLLTTKIAQHGGLLTYSLTGQADYKSVLIIWICIWTGTISRKTIFNSYKGGGGIFWTFWCRSGSAPMTNRSASGSNSFLQWLKECKKILLFPTYFFLIKYPQVLVHYLQSLIYWFKDKFWVKIFFCKHYFSPLNTYMRKGKDPDLEPDPYLWIMDPHPGGPNPQHWLPEWHRRAGTWPSRGGAWARTGPPGGGYPGPPPAQRTAHRASCMPRLAPTSPHCRNFSHNSRLQNVIAYILWIHNKPQDIIAHNY
jgi:hypothetical protein